MISTRGGTATVGSIRFRLFLMVVSWCVVAVHPEDQALQQYRTEEKLRVSNIQDVSQAPSQVSRRSQFALGAQTITSR